MPVEGIQPNVRASNVRAPSIMRFDVVCVRNVGKRSDGLPFVCWTRMDFVGEDGTNYGQERPDGVSGWWTCFRGHRLRRWKWMADERSREDRKFAGHAEGGDHRVARRGPK